ncbi:MAG: hypothetical protein QXJ06_05735, partial [Candidatus Aenigmatarchaeota archaeon]
RPVLIFPNQNAPGQRKAAVLFIDSCRSNQQTTPTNTPSQQTTPTNTPSQQTTPTNTPSQQTTPTTCFNIYKQIDENKIGNNRVNFVTSTTDVACCSGSGSCVLGGICTNNIDIRLRGSKNDTRVFCQDNRWKDCDYGGGVCGYCFGFVQGTTTPLNWIKGGEQAAFGEYDTGTSIECCGDDENEYVIDKDCNNQNIIVNGLVQKLCCNSQDDRIVNNNGVYMCGSCSTPTNTPSQQTTPVSTISHTDCSNYCRSIGFNGNTISSFIEGASGVGICYNAGQFYCFLRTKNEYRYASGRFYAGEDIKLCNNLANCYCYFTRPSDTLNCETRRCDDFYSINETYSVSIKQVNQMKTVTLKEVKTNSVVVEVNSMQKEIQIQKEEIVNGLKIRPVLIFPNQNAPGQRKAAVLFIDSCQVFAEQTTSRTPTAPVTTRQLSTTSRTPTAPVTTRQLSTTSRTPTAPVTTDITVTTTLISEQPNLFIKLKGDYDMPFEYTRIYINSEDKGKICENCNINCNVNEPLTANATNIDINKYCGDESGRGIIKIDFVDSSQVNECNSEYKVCIKLDKEYCCDIKCTDENCKRYVAFDCDSWSCLELKNIMFKDVSCDNKKCNIRVLRNILNSKIRGIIILFDEKNGRIYYLGIFDLNENFIGLKTVNLRKIEECSNIKLKIMINLFKENNLIESLKVGEMNC